MGESDGEGSKSQDSRRLEEEEEGNCSTKPASASWTRLFLDDYEMQVGPVSAECRRRLEEENDDGGVRAWLGWFAWDCLLCYFAVGPMLVAFWRGAWDIAGISWNKVFGVRKNSSLFVCTCVPATALCTIRMTASHTT